jgi:CDP-glucose 4,6-dehydratase
MESMVVDKNFWKNKNVLITGHTGFKGSWLAILLNKLEANVSGFALNPIKKPNLYELSSISKKINSYIGDLSNYESVKNLIKDTKPEIIIHMAAQAIVRKSYQDPVSTYSTNIMGTVNLLETSMSCKSLKAFINITSDKCYENHETNVPYTENDRMGGHDPYSCSKGCSELITNSFWKSYYSINKVGLASARAGNVIGGGDWSDDRLVPDILQSCQKNNSLDIRNPNSTRPWQHVLEPLSGYLKLAEKLYRDPNKFSGGWNFGPDDENNCSVYELASLIVKSYGAEIEICNQDGEHPHEASLLMLNNEKAKKYLQWHPKWKLKKTIENIVNWHKGYIDKVDISDLCNKQIDTYLFK